jgi:hypothetical protein
VKNRKANRKADRKADRKTKDNDFEP